MSLTTTLARLALLAASTAAIAPAFAADPLRCGEKLDIVYTVNDGRGGEEVVAFPADQVSRTEDAPTRLTFSQLGVEALVLANSDAIGCQWCVEVPALGLNTCFYSTPRDLPTASSSHRMDLPPITSITTEFQKRKAREASQRSREAGPSS